MRATLKVVDTVTLLMCWVAAVAVVLMMIQVTLDVILSNFFDFAVTGTLTLVANYYMPLITFLPLAFVERIDKHISVEVLTGTFSARSQKHLYGWIYLVCTVVCGLITYGVWIEAVAKYHIGSFEMERSIKIIVWPVRFSAPLGYGFLTLLFTLKFIGYLTGNALDGAAQRLSAFSEDLDVSK